MGMETCLVVGDFLDGRVPSHDESHDEFTHFKQSVSIWSLFTKPLINRGYSNSVTVYNPDQFLESSHPNNIVTLSFLQVDKD